MAEVSDDEWSVDVEGKHNSNTTVYSPAVGSYSFVLSNELSFLRFFYDESLA